MIFSKSSLSTVACSTVLATLLATAAVAQVVPPGQVPLFDIVYYSDATLTAEVGRNTGVCYGGHGQPIWAGASEFTQGQTTAFYRNEQVGRCTANGAEYF